MNNTNGSSTGITLVVCATLILLGFLGFYVFCLNHVDVNEVGVAYNPMDGSVWIQQHDDGNYAGWFRTSPLVKVTCLSLLPLRVQIPSDAKIINMKIVRFNPAGAVEFVHLQGFSYSLGQYLENILLGYAYSGQSWPFLEIMQEAGPDATSTNLSGYSK